MNEKFVCFVCITEYHLLISFILSTTIYKKRKKIIFFEESPRLLTYKNLILSSKTWNEKYFFNSNDTQENIKKNYLLWSKKIDILHYFSFGVAALNSILLYCNKLKIKTILTDEGLASYNPHERWSKALRIFSKKDRIIAKKGINGSKEFWLLNPKLYLGIKKQSIKKINFKEFILVLRKSKNITKEFTTLFPIKNKLSLNCDYIFFRQSLGLLNSADNFFDDLIDKLLKHNQVLTKDHPSHLKGKNKILPNIPWEAIIIYHKVFKLRNMSKVFISIGSSAMFNTCSLGIKGTYIFMNKIAEKYTGIHDNTITNIIKICKKTFATSSFYQPKDWQDLLELITSINKKYKISPPTITNDIINKIEINWLIKELIHNNKYKAELLKINQIQLNELSFIKSSKIFKLLPVYFKAKNVFLKFTSINKKI